jgi:hypothetical protein
MCKSPQSFLGEMSAVREGKVFIVSKLNVKHVRRSEI